MIQQAELEAAYRDFVAPYLASERLHLGELREKNNGRKAARVREHVAIGLAARGWGASDIADYLHRDHSTILYYLGRRRGPDNSEEMQSLIQQIKQCQSAYVPRALVMSLIYRLEAISAIEARREI